MSGTNKKYKVCVLNKNKSQIQHAIIGVSLNSRKNEGEKFFATVNWAKQQFTSIEIHLYDTVHKHNIIFREKTNHIDAHIRCLREGDEWIMRHKHIIGDIPVKRFDDLYKIDGVHETFNLLKVLNKNNYVFNNIIYNDIRVYWKRLKTRYNLQEKKFDLFYYHSSNYILEELAVMSCWHKEQDGIEIYPGSFLKIFTDPRRFQISGLPKRIKNYPHISIDFVRDSGSELKLAA